MSKSRRRPYLAITGHGSAKKDKRMAARGMRRRQNRWLRVTTSFEDTAMPLRGECAWNNTYQWARDGRQRWIDPEYRWPALMRK